jgi:cytochrome P450
LRAAVSAPLPPRYPGHWLWGSLMEFRKDPIGVYTRGFQQQGDLVAHRMGPFRAYQVNHPELLKQVLVDKAQAYGKGNTFDRLKPLLGNGLVVSDGELWLRQRRLAQPAFHRERLAELVKIMVDTTGDMLQRWERLPPGGTVDLAAEMMRLTLDVVSRTLFGADVAGADEVAHSVYRCIQISNDRFLSLNPLVTVLPSQANREFDKALQVVDRAVFRMIEQRRHETTPRHDLLAMLMEAVDEETRGGMSNQQLRDEVMTLFVAGQDTTAAGLAWLFSLLHVHPETARGIREEVAEVVGNREPTAQDLSRLVRTRLAFEETLRLYPPAWAIGRVAKEDSELGGYQVPRGTFIIALPWIIHRHPAFWEDPERFDPERFTPERVQQRARHAYVPFGAGQRQCIGNNFAMMEVQLVAAMVLRRFKLELVSGQMPEPHALLTLRPKGSVPVRLLPVEGAPTADRPG